MASRPIEANNLQFVADQIRAWMAASLLRLQDMRLQMDDDSNGCIERDEVPKAIRKIGSDAPPKVMDAIIKSLD